MARKQYNLWIVGKAVKLRHPVTHYRSYVRQNVAVTVGHAPRSGERSYNCEGLIAVFFRLLVLFTVVPLVELALLLYLAELTDWRFTLGLVIVTGLIGTVLARREGFRTYRVIRQELAAGRIPGASMFDAVMIFIAGALLLTPGILTDAFGFTLLLPPCRAYYRRRLIAWFRSHFTVFTDLSAGNGGYVRGREVIDSHVVNRGSDPGVSDP
jgi:UPF0716 protein FxsA